MNDGVRKSAFVGLCGYPNAGKSTIFNKLIGIDVAAVSSKVQTTRESIRGVDVMEDTQIVYIDTPGLFSPETRMEKYIVKNAWNGLDELDIICIVCDVRRNFGEHFQSIVQQIQNRCKKCVILLNKIDLVSREHLFEQVTNIANLCGIQDIFPMSGLKGKGLDIIKNYVYESAKPQEWMFEVDDITDKNNAYIASEITREAVFTFTHAEIPYSIYVNTSKFTFAQNIIEIEQEIFVSKQSHKKMLIGKNGHVLKRIKAKAASRMERFWHSNITLFIRIKHSEDWQNKINTINNFQC